MTMRGTNRLTLVASVKRAVKRAFRPLTQPWLKPRRIVEDLRAMGVGGQPFLFVHSSLSSLGYCVGGIRGVLAALQEASSPNGTLVLPTHSWEQMEAGCRLFDVRHTACCVGAIPESFRGCPGVVRSLHPTHSVAALGPRAEW